MPATLEKIIHVCETFGAENDMTFCDRKTNCMFFPCHRSRLPTCSTPPSVKLYGTPLPYVLSVTYLGYQITPDLSDDDSIRNQTRQLYTKANSLIRTFGNCSAEVKRILFVAHCSPMYCVQLWNNHSAGVLQRLRVAYHDAFKIIMSQPRSTSNSLFFAQLGVDTFDARRRKLTHSFAARLLVSGNGIISLLLRSDAFPRSQFWRRYCQLVCRP
ncbi:PREDICTED: uncharacterized protein LOC109476706 [Branchiostoma belcheri]|uniref:Uncharacterized protein LOC109476706 n=1 Tax=Branchiostoma belcheri TaxID=7741 RepID=A0A6P4Z9C6_BRABE|nr:PREDICTED: uncharacterized protein LOC109476706 [Branchiostoma belcheri]